MAGPRLTEIDGVRGWAALCVVVFHLLQETMGIVHPAIVAPGLRLFMDVHALDRVIAKRYFRLSVPILLAILVTYAIMKFGLTYNRQAGDIVQMGSWLGIFLNFPPSLYYAVSYALGGVYDWVAAPDNWNDFLWTMPVELFGSLLVFSYLHIFHRLRNPLRVTALLIVLGSLLSDYYGLFFIGILLAQLRANGILEAARQSIFGWIGGPLLLVCAYVLERRYYEYPWPAANRSDLEAVGETYLRVHAKPLLGVLIVCAIYISPPLIVFFRSRVSRLLGRWSFGLYLFQFPVLCSLESYLIVTHPQVVHSLPVALAIAAASIALTAALAEVFSRIDLYALRKIGGWLSALFKPVGAETAQPMRRRPVEREAAIVRPTPAPHHPG